MVARLFWKQEVLGSTPGYPTISTNGLTTRFLLCNEVMRVRFLLGALKNEQSSGLAARAAVLQTVDRRFESALDY